MIRVFLDTNVLVSELLIPTGVPAAILDAWARGDFEVVSSVHLILELQRVLARPKIRARLSEAHASAFVSWMRRNAILVDDPPRPEPLTADPGDDFVVAAARAGRCEVIVSGDAHLTSLTELHPPVLTPRAFLEALRG